MSNCDDCQCEGKDHDKSDFIPDNPGRDVQKVGTARFLGQDPHKIHKDVFGVTGSLGDSQCYLGVTQKVAAIQKALARRINKDDLPIRLIPQAYTIGVSDGQLNGTDRMRYSLIGREVTNDSITLHLNGSDIKGLISVVACDKPPVGTLAAILEHNQPAVILSDGSIKPGVDPETHESIDIVSAFQVAGEDDLEKKKRITMNACCGQGSCGGMFTYNTMQSFIAVLGMEPLQMVTPTSDDPRRLAEFPDQLIDCLLKMTEKGIKPRDIVTPKSLKNALTVVLALGGSTNVALHSVELARAAGIDLWTESITQKEFNELSSKVPVLVDVRPFGKYSMVDIDEKGGLPVIVKELLDEGLLDGDCMTCTGETLSEQVKRLNPPPPDGEIIYSFSKPYKPTGGLRLLSGNIAPFGGAIIKVAGVEGGIENGLFKGKAKVFNSEEALIAALEMTPEIFEDLDMVVIRYIGPRGGPGMPELLDPTSRITALCRAKNITIALMTDGRFSGGSVGFVIGHVGPEAYLGGPIALIENGDTITIDINNCTIDCRELTDKKVLKTRKDKWDKEVKSNGGVHPAVSIVSDRLLKRMRNTARPAILGAGMKD